MNPLRRRSVKDPPPAGKLAAYLVLCGWAAVVLFPLYWLVITSFKLPIQVNSGPSTCRSSTSSRPWTPGAHLRGPQERHPGRTSTTVVVALRQPTLPGLSRCLRARPLPYKPRLGDDRAGRRLPGPGGGRRRSRMPPAAVVAAGATFAVLAATVGRRFRRTLSNWTWPSGSSPSGSCRRSRW